VTLTWTSGRTATLRKMFSRSRPSAAPHHGVGPVRVDDTMTVPVRVSGGLAPIAGEVARRLGPRFDVTVGPPTGASIAVLAAMGREAIAFFHTQHPDSVLLVVKRGATGHDETPADYLDAGADQFVDARSLDELARLIRALSRRLASIAAPVANSWQKPGR
jgi:hypothetical protein